MQDWSNPSTAVTWDSGSTNANPLRTEQLDILLTMLAGSYQRNGWILDLGYGSGQVEQLIFERIPGAKVVGVDNSDAMMRLAEERLRKYIGSRVEAGREHRQGDVEDGQGDIEHRQGDVEHGQEDIEHRQGDVEHGQEGPATEFITVQGDLSQFQALVLPQDQFSHAIAIQSLHHLSAVEMQAAYQRIYTLLKPGGVFFLQDRVRVESPGLWTLYHQVWQRQDDLYGSIVAEHEGRDFEDHERIVKSRGDRPVLLVEHIMWLREVGFEAACLHTHGNRALIVGRKPEHSDR